MWTVFFLVFFVSAIGRRCEQARDYVASEPGWNHGLLLIQYIVISTYFIEYLVSSCRCALAAAFVGFPSLFLGVCEPRGIMYPVQHVLAIFQHPFFVCFLNDLAASKIRTVPAFLT